MERPFQEKGHVRRPFFHARTRVPSSRFALACTRAPSSRRVSRDLAKTARNSRDWVWVSVVCGPAKPRRGVAGWPWSPRLHPPRQQLGAAGGVEVPVQPLDVHVHRVAAEREPAGDLLLAVAREQVLQRLLLPRRQPLEQRPRRAVAAAAEFVAEQLCGFVPTSGRITRSRADMSPTRSFRASVLCDSPIIRDTPM